MRILMLIFLIVAAVALAAVAMSAVARAARDAGAVGRDIAVTTRGTFMQKIAYAALFIVMLGVTSGLLGGL
ncbi:hypothetical protein XM53_16060 [Roseovarius atlanticus]|uniref:HIG1 domain-containing protein n=1 Tax=Roseovarius atlanticus TaxID=1641875 RepID=A0A0T5NRW8_9RHOB|nr:hypothetical protein [Roseovarius atlanticus]KRS11462.1 hypothetical protein XM53_16060 [Roseovarius atlanticus]